jgi:dTDP-4-dehydrorhamnose reductase
MKPQNSNKRVLLLGATGMLGSAVYGVLKDKYRLVLAVRNTEKVELINRAYGGTKNHQVVQLDIASLHKDVIAKQGCLGPSFAEFLHRAGEVDYVVNAIGVTIPNSLKDPALTYFINGGLPHLLARTFGERLIHITTDCVYNGVHGYPYDESSPESPVDLYGLSKSLGEPTESLTIRTSIIGRELDGFTGLIEWFRQQEGKKITGFAEHYWNGVTTVEFGKICDRIMSSPDEFPRSGLYHVFSTSISKYEMLLALQRKYGVRCTIEPDFEKKLNRTLSTEKELNERLKPPSFEEMLAAL